jgi:TP901-1 family phage major tail protein
MTTAAQKGSLFVLATKNSGSPVTYTTLTSARSTDMTINNSQVDVTTITSGGAKTLLAGAGITSMQITLSGVFEDSTQDKQVQAAATANTIGQYKLAGGNGDTYIGQFALSSYKLAGTYNGEQTYSVTLDSSGAIAFTPGT